MNTPARDTAEQETLRWFGGDDLRARVFLEKYALRGEDGTVLEPTPPLTWDRVAREIASVEPGPEQREHWSQEFRWLLDGFRFLPGGRILHGAGNSSKITLLNCYFCAVRGDSIEAIYDAAYRAARTFSRGGGVGIDITPLRPRGAPVHNAAKTSTGAVSFMELFSLTTGLIGQCLAEGTPVLTPAGWRPIEVITRGDRVWTHRGWRQVTYVFPARPRDTYELRTRRGYTLRLSTDHKLAVATDDRIVLVPLRDLKPGDRILLLRGRGAPEASPPSLRRVEYVPHPHNRSNRLQDVRQPDRIDPELAYWLGFHFGNGSARPQYNRAGDLKGAHISITVRGGRELTVRRLCRILHNSFGLRPRVEHKPGEDCVRIRVFSKLLYLWLRENGLLKPPAHDAAIPDIIRRSSDDVLAAFVAGLFDANGPAHGPRAGYRFSTVSPRLAEDLRLELLRLGVITVTHRETSCAPPWKPLYQIAVVGRSAQQAFLKTAGRWSHRTDGSVARRDSCVTPWIARALSIKYDRFSYVASRPEKLSAAVLERYTAEAGPAAPEAALLAEDAIESITHAGKCLTYDIEVEDTHKFSAAGLYVSNSSRRGALMITIADHHPDVLAFCRIKRDLTSVRYANISVRLSDAFMRAVERDEPWTLRFAGPEVGRIESTIRARDLWKELVEGARDWAEPGCLFWDRVVGWGTSNYGGMTPAGTNPCSEVPLEDGGACDLGSLNLTRFILNPFTPQACIDLDSLRRAVRAAVRFLDNVLTYNEGKHPLPEQEDAARRGRRIGLGITGLGDALVMLGLRYDSDDAIRTAGRLQEFVKTEAYRASIELAMEKGPFPAFDPEKHLSQAFFSTFPAQLLEEIRRHGLRNVSLLTIPPVGSGSALAGSTNGLEPIFALHYVRRSESLSREYYTVLHPLVAEYARTHGLDLGDLQDASSPHDYLRSRLPAHFVTAHEIDPIKRVDMQAALQQHIDQSISSTVNLPREATAETVERVYLHAWRSGLKGISVYREGSREGVLLTPEEARRRHQLVALADRVDSMARATLVELPRDGTAGPEQRIETTVRALVDALEAVRRQAPEQLELVSDDGSLLHDRPRRLDGPTYRVPTQFGTLFVTITERDAEPYEVFIRLGKAGSDTEAFAEAVGRLSSVILRMKGPGTGSRRLLELVYHQLEGIGGRTSYGFGPNRIRSVPDAIAVGLRAYLHDRGLLHNGNGHSGEDTTPAPPSLPRGADICPRCHEMTLVVDEGCSKCPCGYKEC